MKSHGRKMIAPIVITCLMAAYLLTYFFFIIHQRMYLWIKILIGAIPLAILCAGIIVLMERIKEIRSGEEDDLGQY